MATLGPRSLEDNQNHTLWDLAEMKKIALADGTTFDQVIVDVTDSLNILNRDILRDPTVAGMISVQDEVEVEYGVGVNNGFEELTEFSRPDPQRGDLTGHNIPLNKRGRSLGWTMMGLEDVRMAAIDADIRSLKVDARKDWNQRVVQRPFKMEAEQVGATSGASVPLADGGVADSGYVPLDGPDGESFASSHDHFIRTATLNQASLETAIDHLSEHGHKAPFEIMASEADIATWTNTSTFTGFKPPLWRDVNYQASATERAMISDVGLYSGYIETRKGLARLHTTTRVPTNYFGVYKTYGALDARNPVRVRVHKNRGFGYRLVPGFWVNAPEYLAVVAFYYGVGIGEDRTNGVFTYINGSGDYVTPTIS